MTPEQLKQRKDAQAMIDLCDKWRDTARDEIDNIGGWRDADPEDRDKRFWSTFPRPSETAPNGFVGATLAIIEAIPNYMPTTGEDFAAMRTILAAVETWHDQHHADDLPTQGHLVMRLTIALTAVVGLANKLYPLASMKGDPVIPTVERDGKRYVKTTIGEISVGGASNTGTVGPTSPTATPDVGEPRTADLALEQIEAAAGWITSGDVAKAIAAAHPDIKPPKTKGAIRAALSASSPGVQSLYETDPQRGYRWNQKT